MELLQTQAEADSEVDRLWTPMAVIAIAHAVTARTPADFILAVSFFPFFIIFPFIQQPSQVGQL
ncbi:conserved protein of unknown function [Shewanella benthica]|uniref:Uncharacterized protein n=1 Tax=Shewanella benthica TaxID=43661 RepID=A0A330LY29_9GAMM|nr:conserved protein of unknown function [Shewanella benthica]